MVLKVLNFIIGFQDLDKVYIEFGQNVQ